MMLDSDTTKFSENIVYKNILDELKEKFLQKWNNDKPSGFGNLDDYEHITNIGSGAFGSVILCEHKTNKNFVAVKYMLKENIIRAKQLQNVLNEKRILRSVNFPFLMYLEFSCKDNDCVYLGMPFVNGMDLSDYIKSVKRLDETKARFYAAQVLLGLEYLHYNNLIYRDLKPDNIIIDNKGYIKMIDFGFAKRVNDYTSTICGTPEYFAPEMINKNPYGCSVDWWTFGLFIFELVCGFSAFQVYNNNELLMFSKICEGHYEAPKQVSKECQDIIKKLLQVDISKRYGCLENGCNDIKKHSWFSKIQWVAILNNEVEAPYIPTSKEINKTDQNNSLKYLRSKVNKYNEYFQEF